jgi:hypothetical protein
MMTKTIFVLNMFKCLNVTITLEALI